MEKYFAFARIDRNGIAREFVVTAVTPGEFYENHDPSNWDFIGEFANEMFTFLSCDAYRTPIEESQTTDNAS